MTSVSLVMSDQSISHIGDCEELARSCKNVLELDLAKNELNDWDEVSLILILIIYYFQKLVNIIKAHDWFI